MGNSKPLRAFKWVVACGVGRSGDGVRGARGSSRRFGKGGVGAAPCLCARFRREMTERVVDGPEWDVWRARWSVLSVR